MAPIDLSGLIPETMVPGIIRQARTSSAVLTLGRRVPIPTGQASVMVPGALPTAGFVAQPGGRKPFTDLDITTVELKAEEVAAVIAVPDSYIADASINLWEYARPSLAEAIGLAIDNAVLFGVNAPATFPTGGLISNTYSQAATVGEDALGTISNGMAQVEAQGLPVTGNAAALSVKGVLRNIRDDGGAFLLGERQFDGESFDTIFGVRTAWQTYLSSAVDFITGDWDCLIVGVRQDIEYRMSNEGTIVTAGGVLSAFQDNMTFLKVWARIGAVIVAPKTPASPTTATKPFSRAKLGPTVTPPDGLAAGAEGPGTPPAKAKATAAA